MKRKLVALLMIGVVVMSVGGCGKTSDENVSPYDGMSKSELKQICEERDAEIVEVTQSYNELQEAVTGAGLISSNEPVITDIGDGTGRMTFNTIDGQVEFKSTLEYPNSYEPANTSGVMLSKNMTCKPYENWLIQQVGCTTEMYHTSGVNCKIVVGTLEGSDKYYTLTEDEKWEGVQATQITPNSVKERTLEPWLKELANVGDIRYKHIYLNNNILGVHAETTTMVDSQEAHIIVGMLNTGGNESCTYLFLYTGEYDTLKEEYINNLISSIQIGGERILVE